MKRQPVRPKIWAWALYDFANSAYFTALAGVIFNVYFVQVVVGAEGLNLLGWRISPSSLWGYVVSISIAMVAVSAPILGAVADQTASKKKFLAFFCYTGVFFASFLVLVGPGDVWLAIILYTLSNMALEWSLTFYNGFLPEIATREQMGRVSGFGWALGYVGGVACLVLNLAMIRRPDWFGIPAHDHLPVRISLLVIAVWWGLFAIPTFLWLRERTLEVAAAGRLFRLKAGFRRFVLTLKKLNRYRELVKFLLAFLIYNDGVQTVIVMGAVFGAEVLGMSQGELIPCFILIHVVAFAGSLFFGQLVDKTSTLTALHMTLAIWTGAVLYVIWINQIWEFWLLGAIVGFVLGGIQAVSRALLAQFVPLENSAEFFGFFSASGKFASIFGPLFFALLTDLTGSPRYGIASVVVFFLAGWTILFFVNEQKGIAESEYAVMG